MKHRIFIEGSRSVGRTVDSDFRQNFQEDDARSHSRLLPRPGAASSPEHSTSLQSVPAALPPPQVTQSRISSHECTGAWERSAGQQAGHAQRPCRGPGVLRAWAPLCFSDPRQVAPRLPSLAWPRPQHCAGHLGAVPHRGPTPDPVWWGVHMPTLPCPQATAAATELAQNCCGLEQL